jgi:hypothetical protein
LPFVFSNTGFAAPLRLCPSMVNEAAGPSNLRRATFLVVTVYCFRSSVRFASTSARL